MWSPPFWLLKAFYLRDVSSNTEKMTAMILRQSKLSPRNQAAPIATAAGLKLMTFAPITPLTIFMPVSKKRLDV
ncbi:MAG: hypothetical protein VR65_05890 [Desulfobulbaceae bacterium BRH_c16a]|nr:MAG: hypothetical protein VR65_08815 [Desulfobulbaceae bacterium BRH_c16a]KJS02328.1 MAG: hypothetical protein VR65_05890 [Desulfobulbaceae bacterium BRH_c16a]